MKKNLFLTLIIIIVTIINIMLFRNFYNRKNDIANNKLINKQIKNERILN